MSLPTQVQDWINFECRICNYSDFFGERFVAQPVVYLSFGLQIQISFCDFKAG